MTRQYAMSMALIAFLAQVCFSQSCPFDVTSDADAMTPTCEPVSGMTDTWDLHIELSHADDEATVWIVVNKVSGNRPAIRNLTFDISPSNPTENPALTMNLYVSGPLGEPDNLASLGSLHFDPGFNSLNIDREIVIKDLHVFGDVGFIECQVLEEGYIGGDVTDEIWLRWRKEFQLSSRLDYIEVGGNFFWATFNQTSGLPKLGRFWLLETSVHRRIRF